MKNNVKVLAKDGQELMPTTIEKANKLIAKGEAEIIQNSPLVIKMLKATKRYKQDIFEKEIEYENNSYLVPLGKKYSEENGIEPLYWDIKNGKNYLFCSQQEDMITNFTDLLVEHISKNDNYNMILADPLITNSFDYLGVKNISIIENLVELYKTTENIYSIMQDRINYLHQEKVKTIEELNINLSKIEINGKIYNWDDTILITTVVGKESKISESMYFPTEQKITVPVTANEIYDKLMNNEIEYFEMKNYHKGYSRYITKDSVKKVKEEKYTPKDIILCIQNPNIYMMSNEYLLIDNIKSRILSFMRLGKCVNIHIAFITSNVSASTINSDMLNMIEDRSLVGNFSAGISSLVFEKVLNPKEKKVEGYTGTWHRVNEIKLDISKKEFKFEEDTIFAQTNKLYLINNTADMEGFIEEEVFIKQEDIKENDEDNYITYAELKERIRTKLITMAEDIAELSNYMDVLFDEVDDIVK